MLRLALRGALARKLRLALTAASVLLGVAFVAGTLVLTDTLNATFDAIFGQAEAGVAVVVQGEQSFDAGLGQSGTGEERGLVPDAVLQRVRKVPGVDSVVGVANGYAQLVYAGKAVGSGGAPTLGSAWVGDSPTNPLHLVAGRAPARAGEVVIDQHSAQSAHIPVGAAAEVDVSTTTLPVTVVGIVRFGANSTLAGAALTAFYAPQAQQLLLGQTGAWTTVQAAAAPGVSQQVLRSRIVDAVDGAPVQVLTEKDYVTQQSDAFKKQLKFFTILLLVFAFISVFVAVFIIVNTFTVLVAQRTRELALLRALGASRRQVLSMVVGEAGVVGLVAGVVGLGVGVLVAAGLRAVIHAFNNGFVTVSLVLRPRTVVVALLVGFVVTVLASAVPAVRASRIPPVAAMRDLPTPSDSLRRRTRLGVVLLVVGAGVLVAGVSSGQSLAIGLGALGVFRGVVALSPVLSGPVISLAGRPLTRIWGVVGRLARANAIRSPRRTAATASALMIGIALTTTMSIMAASITSSVHAEIDKSVGADFILTAKSFGPVPQVVATRAAAVPGVGAVTEFRNGAARIGSSRVELSGVTAATVGQTLRLSMDSGSLASLGQGQLLVDATTAKNKHWSVGTRLPVQFALTGTRTLTVGGIYAANPVAGSYLLGLDAFAANFRESTDIVVAATVAPGADLNQVRVALARALAPTPTIQLRDQSQFKADQQRQINQVLVFVLALLVLSLLIAWLGIVNTLALSVVERTREIGLLRAVGMAGVQVRRMVRLEAVVIAVFGALLGVLLGLGYGAALVQSLHSQGITQTAVPVGQLVGYLVIGVIAGVTAAIWPARRASRLDVLAAITTD